MNFDKILSVITNPENTVFKDACVNIDGIDNIKYVVYNPSGREVLSIWGCNTVSVPPKKIMENIFVNGILQHTLSHEKHKILFSIISERYKKEELSNIVLRKDKQNVK